MKKYLLIVPTIAFIISIVISYILQNSKIILIATLFFIPSLIYFRFHFYQRRQDVAISQEKNDIPSQIEKLAELNQSGILTDAEFQAKKEELLKKLQ